MIAADYFRRKYLEPLIENSAKSDSHGISLRAAKWAAPKPMPNGTPGTHAY